MHIIFCNAIVNFLRSFVMLSFNFLTLRIRRCSISKNTQFFVVLCLFSNCYCICLYFSASLSQSWQQFSFEALFFLDYNTFHQDSPIFLSKDPLLHASQSDRELRDLAADTPQFTICWKLFQTTLISCELLNNLQRNLKTFFFYLKNQQPK